jgi:hypothetical protein
MLGSLPLKYSLMSSRTSWILGMPPTSTISSMSPLLSPASAWLLHRHHRLPEQVAVELLEARPGERLREVDAVEECLDLDAHLVLAAHHALALAAQLPQRAAVAGDVTAVLALDQPDEVVHDALVEVLASEVGVAVGGEHLEDTIVDVFK